MAGGCRIDMGTMEGDILRKGESEVDRCLKEEFRRLGIQHPTSDDPVESQAREGSDR